MGNSEFAFVFEGDGREKVEPLESWNFPGSPIPVRRGTARLIGELFDKEGHSHHSPLGNTLWVTLAWAQYKGYGVHLKTEPGMGWFVSKTH